jgi:hypothetical protein
MRSQSSGPYADYNTIGEITRQPMEWVVAKGSLA